MNGIMRTNKSSLILSGVFALLFIFFALHIIFKGNFFFDIPIQEALFSNRSHSLTLLFKSVTFLGDFHTVAIFIVFLLFLPSRTQIGIPLALSALLSTGLHSSLKVLISRPRPEIDLHLIDVSGLSFPSAHSATVLLSYLLLLFLLINRRNQLREKKELFSPKKKRLINIYIALTYILTPLIPLLIFLIGLSRIYLGVHYPSDVLGGWCLGISSFLLFRFVLKKYYFKSS